MERRKQHSDKRHSVLLALVHGNPVVDCHLHPVCGHLPATVCSVHGRNHQQPTHCAAQETTTEPQRSKVALSIICVTSHRLNVQCLLASSAAFPLMQPTRLPNAVFPHQCLDWSDGGVHTPSSASAARDCQCRTEKEGSVL